MAESLVITGSSKAEKYESLIPQLKALVEGEINFIANIANIVAALKQSFNFLWVGVYFVEKDQLVLGPFQGPVACTRINYGRGVCGKSWETKTAIIVEDVDKFPGHIACSSDSRSEIVLPAFDKKGDIFLVLDVDSDQLNDFNDIDVKYLNQVIKLIENLI